MARFADQQTADGIITLLVLKLPKLGTNRAVAECGAVALYTGPDDLYISNIMSDPGEAFARNDVRSEWMSAAFLARRIDETPLGKYVFGNNGRIYRHFNEVYKYERDLGDIEIRKVEAFVSRLFVYASGGHYFTAVCGAKKNRIFYKEENPALAGDVPDFIKALVEAGDVKDVNGIPIKKIRDAYGIDKNIDKAYRLICLGELRMLQHMARWARKAGEKPLAKRLLKEYLERKELYLLERQDTWFQTKETAWQRTKHGQWIEYEKHKRPVYNLSPRERFDNRQAMIAEWGLTGVKPVLYNSIDAIPDSLVPPAYRPVFKRTGAPVSCSTASPH